MQAIKPYFELKQDTQRGFHHSNLLQLHPHKVPVYKARMLYYHTQFTYLKSAPLVKSKEPN